jgi:hypothetical protein
VAIRQPYLRVVGFQEDVLNGDSARRPTFTCANWRLLFQACCDFLPALLLSERCLMPA